MNINVNICDFQMDLVYPILKTDRVTQKVKSEIYKAVKEKIIIEKKIKDLYGCYVWHRGKHIWYCGSFSMDNNTVTDAHFWERIKKYLGTHTGKTNIRVRKHVYGEIHNGRVSISRVTFHTIVINNKVVMFEKFKKDEGWAKMLESILITYWKSKGMCEWSLE